MNSAQMCRANGWGPGTLIAGDEGYGETVLRITAVGESMVLARMVQTGRQDWEADWDLTEADWEADWDLTWRDWHEVGA